MKFASQSNPADIAASRNRRIWALLSVCLAVGLLYFSWEARRTLAAKLDASARLAKRNQVLQSENDERQQRLLLRNPPASVVTTPREVRMEALNQLVGFLGSRSSWSAKVSASFRPGARRAAYAINYPGVFFWPDTLPEDFAALFALDRDAMARLNLKLSDTKAAMEGLLIEHSKAEQIGPDEWRITTAPLPQEISAAMREDFIGELKAVLGASGYMALAKMNGERKGPAIVPVLGGPRDFFDAFGAYSHVMKITRDGTGKYSYKIDYPPGIENGPGSRTTGGSGRSREVFRQEIGAFARMIPPDF